MTSWLRAQRKSELVDIAESIGLRSVNSLKKTELEAALDEYLTENASHLHSDPKLTPYYNIRAKASGSPVKREIGESKPSSRRRTATSKASSATATATVLLNHNNRAPSTNATDEASDEESSSVVPATAATVTGNDALVARTPARALSLASRLPLPASPADVANAVDRSAVAVRTRVVELYEDSGLPEATQVTREALSTVHAVIALVAAFEWYFLRDEILPNRYAFTIPAVPALHTADLPIYLPDFFLLATSAFWAPTLAWLLLSFVLPALFGFFINLSAAHGSNNNSSGRHLRSRTRANSNRSFGAAEYLVDPLVFSVTKAVLVYVVLAQGVVVPGGFFDAFAIARLDNALYGGWKGVLVGTAITTLASLYDAVLRK